MSAYGPAYLVVYGLIGLYFLILLGVAVLGLRQVRGGRWGLGLALIAAPILLSVVPPVLNERSAQATTDAVGMLQILPETLELAGQSVLIVDLRGPDMDDNPCGWLCKAMLYHEVPDQVFVTSVERFDWAALDGNFLQRLRQTAPVYRVSPDGPQRARVRSLATSLEAVETWPDTDFTVVIDQSGLLAAGWPDLIGLPADDAARQFESGARLSTTGLVYTGWPQPEALSAPVARMVGVTLEVSAGPLWFASKQYRHVHAREAQEQTWCRWLDPSHSPESRECPG